MHLKDNQQWRAFDHQNVQSVYVVKMRPRNDILNSHLREDFFDILMQLPGEDSVKTLAEWKAERLEAGKVATLE